MDVNLTAAELVVLAEHLDVDSRFGVGERADDEIARMRAEGWRSLLARGLLRIDGESAMISARLGAIAADILAPLGLLTYTTVVADQARISTVMIGREGLTDATPLAEDVGSYSSTEIDRVLEAIVNDTGADEGAVCRVEVVNGAEQRSEGSIAWAKSAEGSIIVESEDGVAEVDTEYLRDRVRDLVALDFSPS